MMKFYAVVRVIHNPETGYIHSVQEIEDRREAQKRYYNVIASDENNTDLDFHMAMWVDQDGNVLEKATFDYTGTPENAGDMNG